MKNMTIGKPTPLIFNFAVPLLIGNIFQQIYSLVDAIIVGRYLGEEALAGVGSTGNLNIFLISLIMGVTGIWIATPLSWACGCVVPVVRYYTGKWKQKALIDV